MNEAGLVVLVCGGRRFADWDGLCDYMDRAHASSPIARIIHGGGLGADRLVDRWAKSRGIPVTRYLARWQTEGPSAGPRRNRRMLVESKPDMVIAFPGGAGTNDMVTQAIKAGVVTVWARGPVSAEEGGRECCNP
jgi:hypothetical protein